MGDSTDLRKLNVDGSLGSNTTDVKVSFCCVISVPDFVACLKCNCNLWFAVNGLADVVPLLSSSSTAISGFCLLLGDGDEICCC